jgi:hypothetical protein
MAIAVGAFAIAALLLLPAGAAAKKKKPIEVEPAVAVSMTVPPSPQGRIFNVTINLAVTVTKLNGDPANASIAQRCLTAQPFFVAVKQRDVGGGNERYADLRLPGSDGNPGNPTDPFDPQQAPLGIDGTFTGEFRLTIDDSYAPAQQQWEVSAEGFNYIGPPFTQFKHKKRKVRCHQAHEHALPGTVLDSWHLIDR